MTSVAEETRGAPAADGAEPPCHPAEYELFTSDGTGRSREVWWKVRVAPAGYQIKRQVWCGGKLWDPEAERWEPEGLVWPAWPGGTDEHIRSSGAPLADLQAYWTTVGNRLRDSAKWMAAVLGAGLAAVIGTSPLAGMREHRPSWIAIVLGIAGLIFLGTTLILILQVMRPQSVSYTDVQLAQQRRGWFPQSALYTWKKIVESQQDLYLPCGIKCLTSLRQSMIIEEVTLMALARARALAHDGEANRKLCDAQTARAARLLQLRVAAATVATVGEYYRLRYRSTWATYAGMVSGLAGTAAIVAAFAWPLN
jgi:hypothetical protein